MSVVSTLVAPRVAVVVSARWHWSSVLLSKMLLIVNLVQVLESVGSLKVGLVQHRLACFNFVEFAQEVSQLVVASALLVSGVKLSLVVLSNSVASIV